MEIPHPDVRRAPGHRRLSASRHRPTPAPVTANTGAPPLPQPRGELSAGICALLGGTACHIDFDTANADPYGEDLQLALHLCYELHYCGFDSVDPRWEWDPKLLRMRAHLEDRFLAIHSPKGETMPFGLQTKSLIVGVLLGALVIPRVQALVASRTK